MRLHNISGKIKYDEKFPASRTANIIYYTTGMVYRHLSSQPWLACGYVPFHDTNEAALWKIYERLATLTVTMKPKKLNKANFTFPPESGPQVVEIAIDLASLLLDERLTGYIIVALKKCFSFRVWRESSFSNMTYAELHAAISECPSTSPWSSPLMRALHEVSDKSRFPFKMILKWIHMVTISPVAATDPFILDAIQDHDIKALGSRVSADESTLDFFEYFCQQEKLAPYKIAHLWFRRMWFNSVTINGGSPKHEAVEWFEIHRRVKGKGWIDGIRWGDRPTSSSDTLLKIH